MEAERGGCPPPLGVVLAFGHQMTTPPFKQNQSHLILDTKLLLILRTSRCPEEFGEGLGYPDCHRVVCPITFIKNLQCVQPWGMCWGGVEGGGTEVKSPRGYSFRGSQSLVRETGIKQITKKQ